MFLIKLIKAWLLKWTVFGLLEDYDFEELVPSMFGYFKREKKKKQNQQYIYQSLGNVKDRIL